MGINGIELDIHNTRDNQLVVHHNPHLSTGEAIVNLSCEEVQAWESPAGWRVPLLVEVMRVTGDLKLFIEAKGLAASADQHLLSLIAADHNPARCQVHSFDHGVITRLHTLDPGLGLGVLIDRQAADPVGLVRAAGATTLWPKKSVTTPALVAACATAQIHVIVWTVKNDAEAERFTKMGVAGVCRDY